MVRTFFTLTGLHRLVACSESSLRKTHKAMIGAIGAWGDTQDAALAPGMAPRDLLVAFDENFHRGMTLVAMEATSGFLLVEKAAARPASAPGTSTAQPTTTTSTSTRSGRWPWCTAARARDSRAATPRSSWRCVRSATGASSGTRASRRFSGASAGPSSTCTCLRRARPRSWSRRDTSTTRGFA